MVQAWIRRKFGHVGFIDVGGDSGEDDTLGGGSGGEGDSGGGDNINTCEHTNTRTETRGGPICTSAVITTTYCIDCGNWLKSETAGPVGHRYNGTPGGADWACEYCGEFTNSNNGDPEFTPYTCESCGLVVSGEHKCH